MGLLHVVCTLDALPPPPLNRPLPGAFCAVPGDAHTLPLRLPPACPASYGTTLAAAKCDQTEVVQQLVLEHLAQQEDAGAGQAATHSHNHGPQAQPTSLAGSARVLIASAMLVQHVKALKQQQDDEAADEEAPAAAVHYRELYERRRSCLGTSVSGALCCAAYVHTIQVSHPGTGTLQTCLRKGKAWTVAGSCTVPMGRSCRARPTWKTPSACTPPVVPLLCDPPGLPELSRADAACACRWLVADSILGRSRPTLLKWLAEAGARARQDAANAATVRAKAIKLLGAAIEVDVRILSMAEVQEGVKGALQDDSVMVREAALELIGR